MIRTLLSQALCGATLVAGLPGLKRDVEPSAPLIPFTGMNHNLVPFDQAVQIYANAPKADSDPATYNDTGSASEVSSAQGPFAGTFVSAASCASNPNVRYEWDNYSASDKQALMAAIKCLMGKPPSGTFPPSTSRYEDFARLHQMYTPNIHQNAKFLPWHRYFVWVFEQALRNECGFNRAFFWFDETKHAGAFSSSDAFSSAYLGTLGANDHCVTDGAFAGLTCHIGPGTGNTNHCLARHGNSADTAQCSTAYVNQCMGNADYADFERCLEYG
ncbi:hypothetical protein F4777DRAFT_562651 [Nemania sp. FL0916]|nr:hypothetical protein F4777DRAFT_562651 [Nemania sp. FL0916]